MFHLNANANANANAIFQERIQIKMQLFWGRIQMQMYLGYTLANAFELISNVLALY